jgi:hypothetical protein
MCRDRGVPLVMQTPSQAHDLEKRSEPFRSWPLRRWTSYGQGRDAKMAELHGYFRISTSRPSAADREAWRSSLA